MSLRRCNLRALCHCSVAIRIQDLVISFDICSKGYLQVWSRGPNSSDGLPEGADLVSLDEGRGYRLTMPTGTAVTLGPYLSTVEVEASTLDEGSVEGLCSQLGRQPRALSSPKDIFNEWRWVTKPKPLYDIRHLQTMHIWKLGPPDLLLRFRCSLVTYLRPPTPPLYCPPQPVAARAPLHQPMPCPASATRRGRGAGTPAPALSLREW